MAEDEYCCAPVPGSRMAKVAKLELMGTLSLTAMITTSEGLVANILITYGRIGTGDERRLVDVFAPDGCCVAGCS